MQTRTLYGIITVLVAVVIIASSLAGLYYYQYSIAASENSTYANQLKAIGVEYSTDILMGYGNGTWHWYNDTRIEPGSNLYGATIVATGREREFDLLRVWLAFCHGDKRCPQQFAFTGVYRLTTAIYRPVAARSVGSDNCASQRFGVRMDLLRLYCHRKCHLHPGIGGIGSGITCFPNLSLDSEFTRKKTSNFGA